MKLVCVICKKPITGKPYNTESWVGAFCSKECTITKKAGK